MYSVMSTARCGLSVYPFDLRSELHIGHFKVFQAFQVVNEESKEKYVDNKDHLDSDHQVKQSMDLLVIPKTFPYCILLDISH